jgi:transcriptional regulator with XRE-family HTH domain
MIDERINLGRQIKEQRKRQGLSQAQLAEKIDVHEKQIYRIEMGKNSPSIDTVLKIVHVLQMDIRVLDINNLKIFNPVKDEIYALLENATDEELLLYRNIIKTIKDSQRLTTKQKNSIIQNTKVKQEKLITTKKRSDQHHS